MTPLDHMLQFVGSAAGAYIAARGLRASLAALAARVEAIEQHLGLRRRAQLGDEKAR